MVAWHPYYGVMRQSLESTTDLLDNVLPPDSPPDVWITRWAASSSAVDSRGAVTIAQTIEQQNAVVAFITGPLATSRAYAASATTTCATTTRSGTRRSSTSSVGRRPAWYTWCAARHGGDASHPDCAPPA